MRKVVVLSFISLDGVMQAPGGPEEDPSDKFTLGGWTVPYFDDYMGKVMSKQMREPFDLLLGRKTYEIFASYWPRMKDDSVSGPLNRATKYVVSHKMQEIGWKPSRLITGDVVGAIKKLKTSDGPELQVHGSSNLIQTLLKHDLVDELRLKIHPLTLGNGKRLFGEGTIPAAFKVVESMTSPNGVIVATLSRAGNVTTGSFPSPQ